MHVLGDRVHVLYYHGVPDDCGSVLLWLGQLRWLERGTLRPVHRRRSSHTPSIRRRSHPRMSQSSLSRICQASLRNTKVIRGTDRQNKSLNYLQGKSLTLIKKTPCFRLRPALKSFWMTQRPSRTLADACFKELQRHKEANHHQFARCTRHEGPRQSCIKFNSILVHSIELRGQFKFS